MPVHSGRRQVSGFQPKAQGPNLNRPQVAPQVCTGGGPPRRGVLTALPPPGLFPCLHRELSTALIQMHCGLSANSKSNEEVGTGASVCQLQSLYAPESSPGSPGLSFLTCVMGSDGTPPPERPEGFNESIDEHLRTCLVH